MIRECRASILEELLAMGGGRFVPYHKTAMAVAAVVAFLFSLIFRQTAVFEAPMPPAIRRNSLNASIRVPTSA